MDLNFDLVLQNFYNANAHVFYNIPYQLDNVLVRRYVYAQCTYLELVTPPED